LDPDGETKVTCHAAAFPGSGFTSARLMLFIVSGWASAAHPRAAVYIWYSARRPVTGSAGFSGSAVFAADLLGDWEHPRSKRAMAQQPASRNVLI
jgi:hypothetical protein